MTLTQSLERKQGSAYGAVDSKAFYGVARAGWFESADRPEDRHEQPRQRQLVQPDHEYEYTGEHDGLSLSCYARLRKARTNTEQLRRTASTKEPHDGGALERVIQVSP